MKSCIICGSETKHPSYEFCEICFNSSIQELDRRYGKKAGPFSTQEEKEEAPASNPFESKPATHRLP